MYERGLGVALDYTAAANWFFRAAEQGTVKAQLGLGIAYTEGHGVAPDYVQAYKWLNLSAAGSTEVGARDAAAKIRDSLAALMTPTQIAEAQQQASVGRRK